MHYKIFFTIIVACLRKGFFVNPFLLYSQAILETGRFTSNIYKENKNLFGMKKPSKRPTTVISENRGHAVYPSYYSSVIDYILRQKYFNIQPQLYDNDKYINDTFNTGYAEDTHYKTKWKNLLNEQKTFNIYAILFLALVPFGFILYILYTTLKK